MNFIHLTFNLVGIFILNIFVYKYLQIRNRSLTIAAKFIIGFGFSSLTMFITGTVEVLRQHYCLNLVSSLNIYTQIIQYITLGLSQLFGLLACIELACIMAPRSAKSLFMSLYYFSRIITQYIIDEVNNYLSTTSYKLDFSVSR